MSLKAKNFSLMEGQLLGPAQKTSLRDYRLKIKLPEYRQWVPGQFVMLRWGSHIIGRPFAIVDWKRQGKASVLEVWIRQLGGATCELANLAFRGMKLSVTLPLGAPIDSSVLKSKSPILFISGGVGAASILSLYQFRKTLLKGNKKTKDFWIHGERSLLDWDKNIPIDKLLLEEKSRPRISKKIQWAQGRVTQSLAELSQSSFETVVVCGPTPMLEAVSLEIQKTWTSKKVKILLGLEEKMACGIGLCFSCSVLCDSGMKRCCLEGPWFEYKNIVNHFSFRSGALK
ncbi:MAG: hypothetical protein KA116_06425 [Proteobacteria bacterium]|nr:hypothetical protein [Pseudomonadota bacterium]